MSTRATPPVFLNLLQIRLPVAGVGSILHRITGFALVLLLPCLLWLLQVSLRDPTGFDQARALLGGGLGQTLLLLILWGFSHHLLMGLRHLLLDLHIGLQRPDYRYSAWAVMLAAPLLALMLWWIAP